MKPSILCFLALLSLAAVGSGRYTTTTTSQPGTLREQETTSQANAAAGASAVDERTQGEEGPSSEGPPASSTPHPTTDSALGVAPWAEPLALWEELCKLAYQGRQGEVRSLLESRAEQNYSGALQRLSFVSSVYNEYQRGCNSRVALRLLEREAETSTIRMDGHR